MYEDMSNDELLQETRKAAERGPHACQTSKLFAELDRRLVEGALPPGAWQVPLLEVLERPGGRLEPGDTAKLSNLVHDELAEAELDFGGRFSTGPDHVALNLEAVASRIARRIAREAVAEREMLIRAARQQAVRNMAAGAEQVMQTVRQQWMERP